MPKGRPTRVLIRLKVQIYLPHGYQFIAMTHARIKILKIMKISIVGFYINIE